MGGVQTRLIAFLSARSHDVAAADDALADAFEAALAHWTQHEFAARLDAVLDAIYVAFGSGWEDVEGIDATRKGLTKEALQLCELVLRMRPEEPEALGLMALMLHCEARRDGGRYVPLSEQDLARWSPSHIRAAEECLLKASHAGRIGRFQLEAVIQSVHARRTQTGAIDWYAIAQLYHGLVQLTPTLGALLGRAVALAHASGAQAGWDLLQQIPADRVSTHQPYWALQADLLRQLGRAAEAQAAYRTAAALTDDPATREFLNRQIAICRNPPS